jgi:hypothetical protein
MVSQLFPGKHPGESYTVQNFLVDRELTPEQARDVSMSYLRNVFPEHFGET